MNPFSPHIVQPENLENSDVNLGGKAAGLQALAAAGFPVPSFLVVAPGALVTALGADRPEAADVRGMATPDGLQAALKASVTRAFPNAPGPWAVRSSAASEDGRRHSFAGQLASFLNVETAALARAVTDVWKSGYSERVHTYRESRGLPGPPDPPAVVIQRMIPARKSGVAFSADTQTGRRAVAVVALVDGLGEALVSGEVTGRTYHVARDGAIQEPAPDSAERALVCDVAEAARSIARAFGRAQDIEWAWDGEELFILQARPITTLGDIADPEGTLQIWDDSNIAESYSGITTPLTFSFARYIYEEVYRRFCRMLAVPESRLNANADVFGRMLGLVRGRVYYNLLSWYRVLAMLPGFRLNRRFMEQMMGVKEALPAELVERILSETRSGKAADGLAFAHMVLALLWQAVVLPRTRRRYYRRMDDALALPPDTLSDLRADALAAHYRALENRLLRHWDAPLINDFFAMAAFGLLRSLCQKWLGEEHALLANGLVAGQGGMVSAEPVRRLDALAGMAAAEPGLLEALQSEKPSTLDVRRHDFPDFFREYDDYLEHFGDRCMEELKLESLTLRDDPAPLMRSIAGLARSKLQAKPGLDSAAAARKSAREEAEAVVAEILGPRPMRRFAFNRVLQLARKRVRDRENLRLQRTRLFGRVRRIMVELGRRLHEANVLDHPRDVFFLSIDEVLGFVEGTAHTTRLAEIATIRKAEFAAYPDQPAPAGRFETRGMVHAGHDFQAASANAAPAEGELNGTPCCAGVVRGRVRRVVNPAGAAVEPGEILVAARTDPGWILLFPNAAGLLVEHGSLLSHSAIVARELGLPAIVAIPGLMHRLKTGDTIEMNGSTGAVTLIDAA